MRVITEGIFGGPIGWGVAQLLGISFDRFYIKENKVKYPRIVNHKMMWVSKPKGS